MKAFDGPSLDTVATRCFVDKAHSALLVMTRSADVSDVNDNTSTLGMKVDDRLAVGPKSVSESGVTVHGGKHSVFDHECTMVLGRMSVTENITTNYMFDAKEKS